MDFFMLLKINFIFQYLKYFNILKFNTRWKVNNSFNVSEFL